MKNPSLRSLLLLFLTTFSVFSACSKVDPEASRDPTLSETDLTAIRAVSDAYVQGWLADDTTAVLSTLDPEAVLMPAGMRPISGLKEIRQFWWPGDGSRTVVTDYQLQIEEVGGNPYLAFTRGTGQIAFTYEKDGEKMEQTNSTMDLTLYRRQPDGTWRILRRMWGPLNR